MVYTSIFFSLRFSVLTRNHKSEQEQCISTVPNRHQLMVGSGTNGTAQFIALRIFRFLVPLFYCFGFCLYNREANKFYSVLPLFRIYYRCFPCFFYGDFFYSFRTLVIEIISRNFAFDISKIMTLHFLMLFVTIKCNLLYL